jgi:hypothetical protein
MLSVRLMMLPLSKMYPTSVNKGGYDESLKYCLRSLLIFGLLTPWTCLAQDIESPMEDVEIVNTIDVNF